MSAFAPPTLEFPGLRIGGQGAALALSGEIIEAAIRVPSRPELIHRLFAIPALRRLRISLRRGEVRLEFEEDGASPRARILAVASVLRGGQPKPIDLPHEAVVLGRQAPRVFEIRRALRGLTLWRIDSPTARVFHLSHPLLRSESVRRQVLAELGTLADLVHRSVALPLPGREAIVVFARPHRVEAALFAEVLDPVLTRCLAAGPAHRAADRNRLLTNANLALAPAADFLFPPAGVINAGLTWALNRGFASHTLAALKSGKPTLEALYLVIAGLTIVTWQFLPSALMYWLMKFWPRRSRLLGATRRADFLARYRYRPRRVWIERDGLSIETRGENLRRGNIVTLSAGDVVPGDGRIVGGAADVDEKLLTGAPTPVARRPDDVVFAATRILEGSLRVRIEALGDDTASARLAGWIDLALRAAEPGDRVLRKAEQTVFPVLAAGAVSVLSGGLNAAKAVLRPDYYTGPAISDRLIGLATAMRAAHEGVLIQRPAALEQVISADCVIFDDSVAWTNPRGEDFSEMARRQGLAEVVFLGRGSKAVTEALGRRLGFEKSFAGVTGAARLDFITERRRRGQRVIYVGNCVAERALARQADLAIAVVEPPYADWSAAPLALLSADLSRFLQLHALALEAADEARLAFRLALVPNVAAVGGAFLLGSPVWASLVLTNLGTLANYLRSGALLRLAALETRL